MNEFFSVTVPAFLAKLQEAFGYRDAVDILIVAFLVYLVIVLLKRTHSFFILGGIILLFLLYLLAQFSGFFLTVILLRYFFLQFLIFILVVIFQKELRNFFEWIFVLGRFPRRKTKYLSSLTASEITDSLEHLAKNKIGALIVLTGQEPLGRFIEGGQSLDGYVSKPLLLSIFDPSSPGHDGAIVIEGDRVKKFGTHLPLAEKFSAYNHLGTRHRSALGLSQRCDALVLVVSEERGSISLAYHGELRVVEETSQLVQEIQRFVSIETEDRAPWREWFAHNTKEKGMALAIAILLWLTLVFNLKIG